MNNEKIRKFIEANPNYLHGNYRELAVKFNMSYEQARHIARRMRKQIEKSDVKKTQSSSFSENVSTGEANLSFSTPVRIKTKEDLIALGMVDMNEFEIERYEITTWEGYRKGKESDLTWKEGVVSGYVKDSGKLITETLYRVNVKLKRRKLDTDLQKLKELILAEIKSQIPISEPLKKYKKMIHDSISMSSSTKYLLELCLFDFHFGKLSWSPETGEDFDLKIAEERYKTAIKNLLNKVDLSTIERILFPIGNDLIHIDNKKNETTAGTRLDADGRFPKIIQIAKRVLVEVINELSLIAPVDVVVVRGNHDETMSFMMGEVIDAFYHNNPLVTVDNGPEQRKYYQYGLNGIQFTHGNEEKHSELGLIWATQRPELWSSVQYRFAQLGHFHKNKKIEWVSVDEFQGFQVQIIPSLTSTDEWHQRKGYASKKQAKAFLFDSREGMVGEFTISL